jgi:hypothetical protein
MSGASGDAGWVRGSLDAGQYRLGWVGTADPALLPPDPRDTVALSEPAVGNAPR